MRSWNWFNFMFVVAKTGTITCFWKIILLREIECDEANSSSTFCLLIWSWIRLSSSDLFDFHLYSHFNLYERKCKKWKQFKYFYVQEYFFLCQQEAAFLPLNNITKSYCFSTAFLWDLWNVISFVHIPAYWSCTFT